MENKIVHEHLLILNEKYIAKEGDVCRACREPIDSCKSFVYSCSNITSTTGTSTSTSTSGVKKECVKCLLHKTCAELPQKMVNRINPNEIFTLQSAPGARSSCMICLLPWVWFSYESSSNFSSYICFKCALFLFQESTEDPQFEHPGHGHPLAYIEHPSSFKCYACKVNDNILDLSYRCTRCQFWIHKSCGDAPASFQFHFHKHPLILSFFLPHEYRTFPQHCRLCNEILNVINWLYYCGSCRYFTHFQCARSSPMLSSDENQTYSNLVHLPAADELSLNLLLEQFIMDKITLSDSHNNNSSIFIKHWAHKEHDLKLIAINKLYDQTNDDEILLLCDNCVKPIRTCDSQFYGCVPCKYFIHEVCAELSREVQHPIWPDGIRLIANNHSEPWHLFRCEFCDIYSNGIFFTECGGPSDENTTGLDIRCVTLPIVIKHEAHRHQLDQVLDNVNTCASCGHYHFQGKYRCEKCNFYICVRCIWNARSYKHRWDPHPLALIYDAGMVAEHEHEYECEYCSQEIDTNRWFYHCSPCDLSFHPYCLQESSYSEYKYVKFGATDIIRDDLHPLGLTFVLNKKVRNCEKCGRESHGVPVLQCAPCNVMFCHWCCKDRSPVYV